MRTAKTDQTGQMTWLIQVFTGCTCHFVGFVMRWLISWHLIRGYTVSIRTVAAPGSRVVISAFFGPVIVPQEFLKNVPQNTKTQRKHSQNNASGSQALKNNGVTANYLCKIK